MKRSIILIIALIFKRMIIQTPKSMGIAILLTFFFGPLGLLYATITGGVIMIILGIIVGIVTLGLGEVIIWPISIIWSAVAVKKYNENLMNNIMQND